MDPQRRHFLRGRSLADKAVVAPRPPWALSDDKAFLKQCTRCDACLAACPQGILIKGDGGYPEVRFQRSGCTECEQCVTACQPRALVRSPEQPPWSWRPVIGAACLASRQVECRVCGEVCDHQAIRFQPKLGGIAQPLLQVQVCTGCGECQARCPTAAITLQNPVQENS